MSFSMPSIRHKLLQPTSVFGIKLWILIVIATILALLLGLSLAMYLLIRRPRKPRKTMRSKSRTSMSRRLLSQNGSDVEMAAIPGKLLMLSDYSRSSSRASERISNGNSVDSAVSSRKSCHHFTLKEIEGATNGFAGHTIIGCGDYGVVYHGILLDNTHIAVKKLLVDRGRFRDFKGDAEAMWCVRHKNLVKLFGFCSEGSYRMLVYEYVDNGNLKQWLHQNISKVSPLSWNTRMGIIEGIAKGLTYLHEDSEPVILHQHLKASNILLDKQWNPKICDFGISNFIGPEWSHPIAPPMGMSGYLAPEYADRGILDAKSDVYSFGILVMEIVSGKSSVQQSGNEIEEYLIDWVKSKVSTENLEEIVDPKLPQSPPLRQLKRIVLIALRCVDTDAANRPKMSDVIHMLEPRDLLLCDEQLLRKVISRRCSFGNRSNDASSFRDRSNNVEKTGEDTCKRHDDLQQNIDS